MNTCTINGLLRTSAGTLSDVALVNRTIDARLRPTSLFFDLPPQREILQNGDRVKSRILQQQPIQVLHGPGPCDITAKRLQAVSQKQRPLSSCS